MEHYLPVSIWLFHLVSIWLFIFLFSKNIVITKKIDEILTLEYRYCLSDIFLFDFIIPDFFSFFVLLEAKSFWSEENLFLLRLIYDRYCRWALASLRLYSEITENNWNLAFFFDILLIVKNTSTDISICNHQSQVWWNYS